MHAATRNLKCLIIEDEAPAQRILQRYIADVPDLALTGTENNAISGLTRLEHQAIDLLFLDINLPKLSGLDLLRTLRHPPAVILTTAYPEYALESYELNVVDYLLKPFSFARFLQAVRKVSLRVAAEHQTETPTHFFVKSDKVLHRIPLRELRYCKAEGDFVRLVLDKKIILIGETMHELEARLAPLGFLRVHRSYLLHPNTIQKVEGNLLYTASGEVPLGRKYRREVFRLLR